MKHHFLWLSCMVECMWWGMVYNLVGFGGYVNLQIRQGLSLRHYHRLVIVPLGSYSGHLVRGRSF